MNYGSFFEQISGGHRPRGWQTELASAPECVDRFVHAGTGLGKTLGALGAWAYHRIVSPDEANPWPRRLVYTLPMRVLVEQVHAEAQRMADVLNDGGQQRVWVHRLMGGCGRENERGGGDNDWHLYPERNAIFIATQDMALSRGLNRGYGSSPARWPMEFGLFNQDCLWVFDEVQAQGVGAVTGAQLQWFRHQESEAHRSLPTRSWWMSATLRPRWIETVDSSDMIRDAEAHAVAVPEADKDAPVYTATKPVTTVEVTGKIKTAVKEIADRVVAGHRGATIESGGRVSLVVSNTVGEASAIADAVSKHDDIGDARVWLIHSRFRGRERRGWRDGDDAILSRAVCEDPATDLVLVATQVVEAGVDISASAVMVSELAPWPSLVQRFGRAARYGGSADVVVVDRGKTKKDCLPYEEADLNAAKEVLSDVDDVGLRSLDRFDAVVREDSERDERLFKLDYIHQLQRHDLEDLFDTSTDLTGEEIDVSRFIREGEDLNVQVAWFDHETCPPDAESRGEDGSITPGRPTLPRRFRPTRDDLCPVPIRDARDWLFKDARTTEKRFVACGKRPFAFGWSFDDDAWVPLRRGDQVRPGMTFLVDARIGGYDIERGFVGGDRTAAMSDPIRFDLDGDRPENNVDEGGTTADPISHTDAFVAIDRHGDEVADAAVRLMRRIGLDAALTNVMTLAGQYHDVGKAHPAFRCNIRTDDPAWADRDDIAKAPSECWEPIASRRYSYPEGSDQERFADLKCGKRTGFRHELASMLAVATWLRAAGHEALGADATVDPATAPTAWRDAVTKLSADQINVLLFLVAGHHGKVRGSLYRNRHDQEFVPPEPKADASLPIRGVRDGDVLPPVSVRVGGSAVEMPATTLRLDLAGLGASDHFGDSWNQRVLDLMDTHGIFNLAILEAVLRSADVRVSRGETMEDQS